MGQTFTKETDKTSENRETDEKSEKVVKDLLVKIMKHVKFIEFKRLFIQPFLFSGKFLKNTILPLILQDRIARHTLLGPLWGKIDR